jgi:hypothetical protein
MVLVIPTIMLVVKLKNLMMNNILRSKEGQTVKIMVTDARLNKLWFKFVGGQGGDYWTNWEDIKFHKDEKPQALTMFCDTICVAKLAKGKGRSVGLHEFIKNETLQGLNK